MRWLIASLIGSAYVAGSIALAKWSGTPMQRDPNPVWFDAMLYLSCELAVSWLIWASWNCPPGPMTTEQIGAACLCLCGMSPLECFPNVDRQISREGGHLVCGWTVWEWPRVLVEAEFHGVWKSPAGELVDITPKHGGDDQILFLPDPSRHYDGADVDNVRRPLRSDAMIRDFISTAEAIFQLQSGGNRAKTRQVRLSGHEAVEFQRLQIRGAMLASALGRGLNERCPCPCRSKRPYKKCCAEV
jgi:hypothetical protein